MVMKLGTRVSPVLSAAAPARSGPQGVVRSTPMDLDATLPLGQTARLRPVAEVLPMRCLRCQGPVERSAAPVHVERAGYRLAWEQVPAWVCTRCELAYFEPREVETVRRALNGLRTPPAAAAGEA
jgi:YgiT-type zinc finger domain-containing protein